MISKNYFEKMENENLISSKMIEKLKKFRVKVLWGTAGAAMYAKRYLESQNIKFDFVTDSFSHNENEYWNDIPFINKNDVFAMGDSVIVLIACSYGYQIDSILHQYGIQYIQFDTNLLYCHDFDEDPDCINVKKTILDSFDWIQQTYQLLADQKSKDTLLNVLSYCICLDRNLIKKLYEKNIYFGNDVITSFTGDTVVDCGAYIGDSLDSFIKHSFSCRKYYALEPAELLYNKLKSKASTVTQFDVEVLPLAAWDSKKDLYFTQNQGAGNHIEETGSVVISADTIDSITSDECVDLIKMDIEGAEIPALKGAQNTIQSSHPIIASSVYHHLTDFWEIPLLLHEMYDGYKFYMRHHSPWGDDTVVYAIP